MSTLEQIRQRPVLIISILGVALLLFILTAVDRPQELFSDNHTVAKVDGEKIDYLEFQKRVEQVQQNYQNQGSNNVDRDQLQTEVLQEMIQETLLKNEYARLGLTVTDNELSKAILGETPHPYVLQMMQQMGIGDPKMFYDAVANPQKQGIQDPQQIAQLREAWAAIEKQTEEMLMASKFQNLLLGSLNANKLDAQAAYAETTRTWKIAQAAKDAATLDDKGFEPTDAEMQAEYNAQKGLFRLQEPTKVISYVSVNVNPSEADLAEARKVVNGAIASLRTQNGTEGLDGNTAFVINRVNAPASAMAPQLRNALARIQADTVTEVSFLNNTYTLAKLIGSTSQVDSVLVDMAMVTDAALTDSVMAQLNSGLKADAIGTDKVQAQDSIWTSLVDPQMALFKDELATAETGSYFAPKAAPQKGMLLRVRTRKAPVTVYDIAQVTYDVEPSAATVEKLNNDLRNFLSTNNTAEKFIAKAVEAGYSPFDAYITDGTLQVGNLRDSRNVCKWALGAKTGEVSGVFTDERGDRLMGAALVADYNGDFIPMTDKEVNSFIKKQVITRKKADKLVADYKGKANNVADYAKAMGVSVDTTTVAFGRGADAALAANVMMAKKGQLVGPFATSRGVSVFQVVSEDSQAREFNFGQDSQAFNYSQGGLSFQRSIGAVLRGNKKVDNRIQKFYSDRQN